MIFINIKLTQSSNVLILVALMIMQGGLEAELESLSSLLPGNSWPQSGIRRLLCLGQIMKLVP